MEHYELTVEGMSCGGCEDRVSNAAKQVEGVHRVVADHESASVEITADEGTAAAIRKAIHAAGYDVAAPSNR